MFELRHTDDLSIFVIATKKTPNFRKGHPFITLPSVQSFSSSCSRKLFKNTVSIEPQVDNQESIMEFIDLMYYNILFHHKIYRTPTVRDFDSSNCVSDTLFLLYFSAISVL